MKYVVLGASAAGISAAQRIKQLQPLAEVLVISKDEHIYSRCILHDYMAGTRDLKRMQFVPPNFMEGYGIEWLKGDAVTAVDCDNHTVTTESGQVVTFDKLLIATGSHVFFPPIPGLKEATNALGFHDLDECEEIMERAKDAKHIVVMGAGLVGIDATTGLLHMGKKVTIIEMRDRMLAIQLDHHTSQTYQALYAAKGVTQLYSLGIAEVILDATSTITSLKLTNGDTIPCDLLIVASGVRSNVAFLEGSGIETDRFGLVIDAFGRTSHPDVYGAGDVTGRNPIWPVAVKEGIIAASNMCGVSRHMTDFFASKSTMNFMGVPTLSLGNATPEDDSFEIVLDLDDAGNYKKVVHKDGKIYGALLQGDISYAGVLAQLIKNETDISRIRKPLFKIDYSDFFHQTSDLEFTYDI